MNEEKPPSGSLLPRVALVIFGLGLVAIAIGFCHTEGAAPWLRGGAVAWLLAYFIILADNFLRKLPVQTRGGVVRREDGAFRYALPFIVPVLLGLGALLVVLTAQAAG